MSSLLSSAPAAAVVVAVVAAAVAVVAVGNAFASRWPRKGPVGSHM